MSLDLSLTGQSISPVHGRVNSARSSHSTASDSRKSRKSGLKSATPNSSKERGGRGPNGAPSEHSKPSMAIEFPKSLETSSSKSFQDNSTDYLTFFENNKRPLTAKNSEHKQVLQSRGKKSHGQEDRFYQIPNSYRSISTYSTITESRDSDRQDISTFSNAMDHEYDKDFHEEKESKLEIRIPTQTNVLQDREEAAIAIQKWYKHHSLRTKSSQALQRILQQKKNEMKISIEQNKLQTKQHSEEQRQRQRKEREREARKKAIEELRKSRAGQNEMNKSLVDEEMASVAKRRRQQKTEVVKHRMSLDQDPSEAQVVQNVEEKIDRLFEETQIQPKERVKSETEPEKVDEKPSEAEKNLPETDSFKGKGLLESLLHTIEKLEEQPAQLKLLDTQSKLEEKFAWIDEMESDHQGAISRTKPLDCAQEFVNSPSAGLSSTHSILTRAKLNNLMEFLDDVERKDEEYETVKFQCNEPAQGDGEMKSEKIIKAEKAASQVTSEMLKLRLNVDEKTKSIEMLKKALSQQRDLTIRHAHEHEKELNQRMKLQKDQYESAIQRHLSFIDQLIDDKKVLSEKCEQLVLEMKQMENKYQKKIKKMQEEHAVELNKMKGVFAATEKLRRDKWIEDKTKAIKEMTVKGLEPEIQRLIAKHKQEVKRLKAIHEAELLQSDERAGKRYIRQTEELREQLESEKESACTREREMARQRYEKQLEQEEMALQQQRRRMYAEVSDEKERLNQQAARQRDDINRLKEQLENQNSLATTALTEQYNKSKLEAERRHGMEIETLIERLELEKQAWQENYIKKQEAFLLQKERELKDTVRKDRDSEIESVIEQLEKDVQGQRDQTEKTAENRIKRIREKYELELKELELLERQTQEKYNAMKIHYSEMEGNNMKLQSIITQKELEITDVKKIKDKLVEERGKVADIVREEFAERLVHIEEENKRLKSEVAQMKARHRLELDRINEEKEEELAEVHKRVKAAILKKEEAVSQIKLQHESALKRADHLESLLETQRKQLFKKK